MPDNSEYRQLEAASRRPVSADVLHPDRCVDLTLQGVRFGVQPLAPPKSVRFMPDFSGGEVGMTITACDGGPDPELVALASEVTEGMPVDDGEVCETCGHRAGQNLVVDLEAHHGWLCTVAKYAAALLRKQYALTDGQLADLLAFDGSGLPPWIMQCIRHALSLPAATTAVADYIGRLTPART